MHVLPVWNVAWVRRLVAGLSLWMPGFDSRPVVVGFVVEKVESGQVFPPRFSFSLASIIPSLFCTNLPTPYDCNTQGRPETCGRRLSLNILGIGRGWRTFLRAHAQTADNSRKNSFACGKLEFTDTVFAIKWRLSAVYRLAPRAAARLARPLQSWQQLTASINNVSFSLRFVMSCLSPP
jgi:hypothetical protein